MMPDGDNPLRPEDVNNLADLKRALKTLSGGRSLAALEKDSVNYAGDQGLPDGEFFIGKSTLSDLFRLDKGTPTLKTLEDYLTIRGLTSEQRKPWISAWERARRKSIEITAESQAVEAAPAYLAMIDAWITLQEQRCIASPGTPSDPLTEIKRFVNEGFGLISEASRLMDRLPERPAGRADPIAFGRFGGAAVDLFLQRLTKLPETIGKARTESVEQADFPEEVARYLQECRDALKLRARIMIAGWPDCRLRLRLTNPGESVVRGLTVRFTIPDGVEALEPALSGTPLPGLPPRPTRSGSAGLPSFTLSHVFREDLDLVRRLVEVVSPEEQSYDYSVPDASTVVISGIDVPAKGAVALPRIPLLVSTPVDADVTIEWTATGVSPHERFVGSLDVPVVSSTLSLDRLLPST